MTKGIHHVAIAVENLEATMTVYRDLLGFHLEAIEDVPSERVKVAVLTKGGDRVELVQPAASDSPLDGFLKKRGPGLHHICLEVEGLAGVLARLAAKGVPLLNDAPKPGAEGRMVAFIHPRGTGGVLIELSEAAPDSMPGV